MDFEVSNKELAEVFRETLIHLRSDVAYVDGGDGPSQSSYICFAIGLTDCREVAKEAAKKLIASRLGKFSTVTSWLRYQVGRDAYLNATWEQIQAHRIAWVKLLIEEFETKKD